MPSHRTHDMIALSVTPVLTLASTSYTEYALLFGAAFIFSNYYLSPDLDTKSIMDKRWGVLRIIWIPYRKIFHHRSIWTHSGPLSANIRMFYLTLYLTPLLYLIPILSILSFVEKHKQIFICVYIAIIISDALHTGVDYGSTFLHCIWKNTKRLVRLT